MTRRFQTLSIRDVGHMINRRTNAILEIHRVWCWTVYQTECQDLSAQVNLTIQNFQVFLKFSIFCQIFNFLSNFQFFVKFSIFCQIFNFLSNFQFFCQIFNFLSNFQLFFKFQSFCQIFNCFSNFFSNFQLFFKFSIVFQISNFLTNFQFFVKKIPKNTEVSVFLKNGVIVSELCVSNSRGAKPLGALPPKPKSPEILVEPH